MKVRELQRQLKGANPDLEVLVRAHHEEGSFCGTVDAAAVRRASAGNAYFAVDCSSDPAPSPPKGQAFEGVVPPSRILATVANAYEVPAAMLLRGPKTKALSEARFLCWWLLRAHTNLSLPAIGRMFHRNHTTVLYGVHKAERQREANEQYRRQVDSLVNAITSPV